jgi:hypothetical protein
MISDLKKRSSGSLGSASNGKTKFGIIVGKTGSSPFCMRAIVLQDCVKNGEYKKSGEYSPMRILVVLGDIYLRGDEAPDFDVIKTTGALGPPDGGAQRPSKDRCCEPEQCGLELVSVVAASLKVGLPVLE